MERVKVGRVQMWRGSGLEGARCGECQGWKELDVESVGSGGRVQRWTSLKTEMFEGRTSQRQRD
jgi:hypothetical protein